jgi:hypothetical protein
VSGICSQDLLPSSNFGEFEAELAELIEDERIEPTTVRAVLGQDLPKLYVLVQYFPFSFFPQCIGHSTHASCLSSPQCFSKIHSTLRIVFFRFSKSPTYCSRIFVLDMIGRVIAIDNASADDNILSVKQRVFAANCNLYVRRQRIVYCPGPFGIDPLADDQTLGGAGVTRDGSAKLVVLLADLSADEVAALGPLLLRRAKRGHSHNVRELLACGADKNVQDGMWRTPLCLAASSGQVDCVRLLLDAGADTEIPNVFGNTAIIAASEKGSVECIRLLIDAGAKFDAPDLSFGWTALIYSALRGHAGCVHALMDRGANMEARDRTGRSALIWASVGGHADCVRMLLSGGADKNAQDNEGVTALIAASRSDHIECARLLGA